MQKSLQSLHSHQSALLNHPIYSKLETIQSLRIFMEYHVYAVWDFMSLLKALQNKITCTDVPWVPSIYSDKIVRFVNEIVLAEESDLNQDGHAVSHFNLYVKAMNEIDADTSGITNFITNLKLTNLPKGPDRFVSHHLNLSLNASVEEVAGSFLFGREKLLPSLFEKITKVLKKNKLYCPTLVYYFERHIELDGDSHGPLAQAALEDICGRDEKKWDLAYNAGIQSMEKRKYLWDCAQSKIEMIQKSKKYIQ